MFPPIVYCCWILNFFTELFVTLAVNHQFSTLKRRLQSLSPSQSTCLLGTSGQAPLLPLRVLIFVFFLSMDVMKGLRGSSPPLPFGLKFTLDKIDFRKFILRFTMYLNLSFCIHQHFSGYALESRYELFHAVCLKTFICS